jgi:hypothetical protein
VTILFTVSTTDCKSCSRATTVRQHLGRARLLLDMLSDGEQLRGAQLDGTLQAIAKELAAAQALTTL